MTTASKLASLGLLVLFRLFITQASLFLVVLVPACTLLGLFFFFWKLSLLIPRCLLFLVMMSTAKSKRFGGWIWGSICWPGLARLIEPVSQLQRDIAVTEDNDCSSCHRSPCLSSVAWSLRSLPWIGLLALSCLSCLKLVWTPEETRLLCVNHGWMRHLPSSHSINAWLPVFAHVWGSWFLMAVPPEWPIGHDMF